MLKSHKSKMYPPGYHHNGFVATHALGHIYAYMYILYIYFKNATWNVLAKYFQYKIKYLLDNIFAIYSENFVEGYFVLKLFR